VTGALDLILAPGGLSVVFQPILELKGGGRTLHALECLVRGPRDTDLENADVMFEFARRKGAEDRIDRACLFAAFGAARHLDSAARLCVNIHASTLSRDDGIVRFLCESAQNHGIDPARLTVEIIEHAPALDGRTLLQAVERLRSMSVKIALDDIGLGQSNYKMILDVCPDYFKIDRYIVQGSHRDRRRQAILESICQLALRFDARVVAEGIENAEDFLTIQALGIDLIQGHLFSRARPLLDFMASPVVAGLNLRSVFSPV
jgi:EAL domain-containing protein (putative c-di-GMP-specific phosphodiesterase class I)